MSTILDELKNKYPDTEGVQKANNIAEGVAAMPTGGGGSGAAPFIINVIINTENGVIHTLDKTWQEIHDAYMAGSSCIVIWEYDDGEVSGVNKDSVALVGEDSAIGYEVVAYMEGSYITDTADGYPSMVIEDNSGQ